jgi:hypothetical protein
LSWANLLLLSTMISPKFSFDIALDQTAVAHPQRPS